MRCEHGTPGVRPPLTFSGGEGGDQSRIILVSLNTLLNVAAQRPPTPRPAPHGPTRATTWGHTPRTHGPRATPCPPHPAAPRPPHGPWAITLVHGGPAPRACRKGMEVSNVPRHTLPNLRPSPPNRNCPIIFPLTPHTPARDYPPVRRTSAMPGPTWVDRFLSSNAARLDPRRAHEILREFRGEPLQNAGRVELGNVTSSPAGPTPQPTET